MQPVRATGTTSAAMPPQRLPPCPLCASESSEPVPLNSARRYFRCPECSLTYLDPAQRPGPAEERARYELHRNEAADPGYLRFLRELADPMIERLQPGARGLDFGCGPVPALASLFTAAGFPCVAWDPYFAPDPSLLDARYDFIACSEVLEHVYDPAAALAQLSRMLGDHGMLGIMTRFRDDDAVPFASWWYRRDVTHVCFYAESTIRWIAGRHGWSVELPRANVALFTVRCASPRRDYRCA